MVRKFLVAIIISIVWSIAAVVIMTYGVFLNWPDFVHINYGFPLTFAIHTLDTFAGPVDKWSVDLGALAVDLSFWFLGMVLIFVASGFSQSRNKDPHS